MDGWELEVTMMKNNGSFLLLTSLGALSLITSAAMADEACGDTTCPKGFVCTEYEQPCADISIPAAPADGAVEEAGDPEGADDRAAEEFVACEPSVGYYCTEAPCEADADCGADMVCHTETRESCSGASGGRVECDPESGECTAVDLPDQDVPDCEVETEQLCTFQWALPCTEDADCGPNFTCEEQSVCSCSVSAPVDSGDGASAGGSAGEEGSEGSGESATSIEEDCSCRPTGTSRCELVETACESDDDCLGGWLCLDNPSEECSGGSDEDESCTADSPAKLCLPPYTDILIAQDRAGGGAAISSDSSSGGESIEEAKGGDSEDAPSADADDEKEPNEDGDDADDAEEPSQDADDADDDSADSEGASNPEASGGGGCSVSSKSPGSSSLLGLALGFAALLGLRRRSTRA